MTTDGERRVRRLQRRIEDAVEDYGANLVLEVLEASLTALEGGGGRGGTPSVATRTGDPADEDDPVVAARKRAEASRVRVMEARRARKREAREARANEEGPAIRRGGPGPIVTRDPEN